MPDHAGGSASSSAAGREFERRGSALGRSRPVTPFTAGEELLEIKLPDTPGSETGLLLTDEACAREDWIRRAHGSECASAISEVLQDKWEGTVRQLKEQMFGQIYECMGGDVAPEDLERALVVKNAKFLPCTIFVLTVLSLGLFCVFRPRDDDTVLVLTKSARVLMLKVERPPFFGGNGPAVLLAFLRYLLVLGAALSLPLLLLLVLNEQQSQGDSSVDTTLKNLTHAEMNNLTHVEMKNLTHVERQVGEDLAAQLRRNFTLMICIYVAFIFGLLFWLWTKCPHDYGTGYRQSHAASSISAAQFVLTGWTSRRRAVLRLFFGKYPPQEVMDSNLALNSGHVVGPIPRRELNASGPMVETRAFKPGAPTTIIGMGILLSVVTILDSTFAWIDRTHAMAHVEVQRKFCLDAAERDQCHRDKCREWARGKRADDLFCNAVRWYDDPEDGEHVAICLNYYHDVPPCCGGCTDGLAIFKGWLGVLADMGTIAFSFIAAKRAMTVATVSDHVDVSFVRKGMFANQTSNFDLTQPLALNFLESVFAKAGSQAGSVAGDPCAEPPGVAEPNAVAGEAPADSGMLGRAWNMFAGGAATHPKLASPAQDRVMHGAGQGVRNFELHDAAKAWDDFFQRHLIVAQDLSRLGSKVVVPKRCLGIPDDEQVLAAWAEMPHMTFGHVVPHLVAAAILWLVLASNPAVLVGAFRFLNLKPTTRAALGVAIIFLFFSVATTYVYFFSATQHAVVVTNLRLFYVRHRRRCLCLCMFGDELRVDTFRHDREVFQGRLNSTALTLVQRLLRRGWFPGDILMQVKFGVLQLTRSYGDASDVYHVISQLTRSACTISRRDVEAAGVDWAQCQQWVGSGMERKSGEVWSIACQPDDIAGRDRDLHLRDASEQIILCWSFAETGALSTPYNINTDVVVTTGRVFLWSRAFYKHFDCKTVCCWGICWCACLTRLFYANRLPSSMCFLALGDLLSFSTETAMDPPVWYDPHHAPVKIPCCENVCTWLTRCTTWNSGWGRQVAWSVVPSRTGPRAQLRMMWRVKQNLRPDMICTIRPYALPGCEDVDLLHSLGSCCGAGPEDPVLASHDNSEKLQALRRVMGIAQVASSRRS